MLENLKKEFILRRKSLLTLWAIIGGIWLAFYLLVLAVVVIAKADTYMNLSMPICAMLSLFVILIDNVSYFSIEFEQAIRMSRTRKGYLASTCLFDLVQGLSCVLLLAVFALIDNLVYGVFFKSLPLDAEYINVFTMENLGYAVGAIVALICISIFIGALLQRFGKAAFWVVWGVYMFFALFGINISKYIETNNRSGLLGKMVNGVADIMKAMPNESMLVLCGGALLAMFIVGYGFLRRATIKK
ncbi:MAG: hypothetical protein RRY03_05790 [Oscillospiraceae bacterium]